MVDMQGVGSMQMREREVGVGDGNRDSRNKYILRKKLLICWYTRTCMLLILVRTARVGVLIFINFERDYKTDIQNTKGVIILYILKTGISQFIMLLIH